MNKNSPVKKLLSNLVNPLHERCELVKEKEEEIEEEKEWMVEVDKR